MACVKILIYVVSYVQMCNDVFLCSGGHKKQIFCCYSGERSQLEQTESYVERTKRQKSMFIKVTVL